MSVIEDIDALVEKRVAAELLSHVLEKLENSHAKRGHALDCHCEYCTLKRRATSDISYIKPHLAGKCLHESAVIGIPRSYYNIMDDRGAALMLQDLEKIKRDPNIASLDYGMTKTGMGFIDIKKNIVKDEEEYFRVKAVREALTEKYRQKLREVKSR